MRKRNPTYHPGLMQEVHRLQADRVARRIAFRALMQIKIEIPRNSTAHQKAHIIVESPSLNNQ